MPDNDSRKTAGNSSNKTDTTKVELKQPDYNPENSRGLSGFQNLNPTNNALVKTAKSSPISESKEKLLTQFNHITYLLYVLSYFTAGLLWIVPIILNYAKRHEADGTWLATHFDWQIKTFWYSIIFWIIGFIILILSLGGLGAGMFSESSGLTLGSVFMAIIGSIIIGLSLIWHIYRIARGWIALADNRPIP